MSEIPAQFTGLAAHTVPQSKHTMDLKPHSYTPRKFTEADVIIKVICCGLCGVRLSFHRSMILRV